MSIYQINPENALRRLMEIEFYDLPRELHTNPLKVSVFNIRSIHGIFEIDYLTENAYTGQQNVRIWARSKIVILELATNEDYKVNLKSRVWAVYHKNTWSIFNQN